MKNCISDINFAIMVQKVSFSKCSWLTKLFEKLQRDLIIAKTERRFKGSLHDIG